MSSATVCDVLQSFVWILVFVIIGNSHGYSQNEFLQGLEQYEVVIPARVTRSGSHVTYNIHPVHALRRRSVGLNGETADSDLHYKLQIEKKDFVIKINQNSKLLSPGFIIETLGNTFGNVTDSTFTKLSPDKHGCHYHGHVINGTNSRVAVGVCNGLHGFIHTDDDQYFIEPLHGEELGPDGQHKHVIYKRSALAPELDPLWSAHVNKRSAEDDSCGVKEFVTAEKRRDRWERHHRKKRKATEHSRHKRSFSTERYVETMVVVDPSMVEYHKNEQMDNYILTIMNMVSAMFHDASIGNSINIVLVRLLIVKENRKDLVITHHADKTLTSFCKFQNMMNFKDDDHPNHHDVAVLLTRKNICSRLDEPCSTLGLAQVAGMCQPHWSCNINEDTGLALAYTVTHEMGHNFGMHHDTKRNGCKDPPGKQLFLMSPSLVADSLTKTWSNCSRDAITKFIDRDWGYCLNDEPTHHEFSFNFQPPGTMYDANHQCRLQYGIENITICSDLQDVCANLWCGTNNRCSTHLEAAAEGTICAPNKWCYQGECVKIGERPESINGEWGEWTSWSDCTRTCGGGVSHSQRHCDNPQPSHGGKYCLGERKRHRICNTGDCPENSVSFQQAQCEEFNYIPYKGHFYEWEHIQTSESPCQLHCKPKNRFFSSLLKDIVTDGTPCTPGTPNMCISGRCRHIGCDFVIDSKAKEDRCGVCHGDGSTCRTIKDQFKESKGLGYVEATVIPRGARNIYVEEMEEANNFLALQNDQGEYYLNGHWFIQWSGDYDIAGTIVQYSRIGNKESFKALGPLKEPLHIMLLLQSENPGISFEYTVPKENISEPRTPEFNWVYLHWTHCTASCGGGTQRSEVVCSEIEAGVVDDKYCRMEKPDDKQKVCNDYLCPARWWTGPWQHCSVTCGKDGTHQRTVICVRSMGLDEQIALDDEACNTDEKPPEIEPCHKKEPCPGNSSWIVGDWSECGDNLCGMRHRDVTCENPTVGCDESAIPPSEMPCSDIQCGQWVADQWSECPVTCGMGQQERVVMCEGGDHCDNNDKPIEKKVCILEPCPVVTTLFSTSLPPSSSPSSPVLSVSDVISIKPVEASTNTVSTTRSSIDKSLQSTKNEIKGRSVVTNLTTVSLDLNDENIEIESFDIEEDRTATSLSSLEDESIVTENPIDIIAQVGKSEDYEPEEDNLFDKGPESTSIHPETDNTTPELDVEQEENEINDDSKKGISSTHKKVEATTDTPITIDVFDIESENIEMDSNETIELNVSESSNDRDEGKVSSNTDRHDDSVSKNITSHSSKVHQDISIHSRDNDSNIILENHENFNQNTVFSNTQGTKTDQEDTITKSTGPKDKIENTQLGDINLPDQASNLETLPRVPPINPRIPELPDISDLPPMPKLEDLGPLPINTNFDPKSLPNLADLPKSLPKLTDINGPPELPKAGDIYKNEDLLPSVDTVQNKDNLDIRLDEKEDKEAQNTDGNNNEEPELKDSKESLDENHSSQFPGITGRPTLPYMDDVQSKKLPNLPVLPNKNDLIPLPDIKDLPPLPDIDDLTKKTLPNLPKLPNKDKLAPLPDINDLPPLPNMEDLPNKELLPHIADKEDIFEAGDLYKDNEIEKKMVESNEVKIKDTGTENTHSKEVPSEITLHDIKNNNEDSLPQSDKYQLSSSLDIKPMNTNINTEIFDSDIVGHSDINIDKQKLGDNQSSNSVLNRDKTGKSNDDISNQKLPDLKWRPSKWTECSRACGDGVRTRTVTCVDGNEMEMDEMLCDINTKPTAIEDCFIQECLEWQLSHWSECSASCGYSVRYRNVVCPKDGACDPRNQPIREELCSKPHCVRWMSGQWSRCSKKCGEGEQVRLVQCVNLTSQMSSHKCDMSDKPSEQQICNTELCKDNNAALMINCEHNEMSSVVCRALRRMGQCHRQFVKLKCCKTCNKDKRQKLNRERPRSQALR